MKTKSWASVLLWSTTTTTTAQFFFSYQLSKMEAMGSFLCWNCSFNTCYSKVQERTNLSGIGPGDWLMIWEGGEERIWQLWHKHVCAEKGVQLHWDRHLSVIRLLMPEKHVIILGRRNRTFSEVWRWAQPARGQCDRSHRDASHSGRKGSSQFCRRTTCKVFYFTTPFLKP